MTIPAPECPRSPAAPSGANPSPSDVLAAEVTPVGHPQSIDRICGEFHRFMRALHSLDRPGWGGLDLTMSQLKTIMLLVESNGLTGRDLADRLGIGASAVTALVDRLVQRGYVRREEDRTDRRGSWSRPTEKAVALFERLHATHRERLADVLREVSSEDLALVEQAVAVLAAAAARQASAAGAALPTEKSR